MSHYDGTKEGEQVKDVAIREHFDTNTNLYVDKYEASYKVICHERIGLLNDYVDAPVESIAFTVNRIYRGALVVPVA